MTGGFQEWYDEKSAARILRVAPRTLRAWRQAGKVGFHRTPGGRVRFTLDQLLAVQQAGAVLVAPPRGVA